MLVGAGAIVMTILFFLVSGSGPQSLDDLNSTYSGDSLSVIAQRLSS